MKVRDCMKVVENEERLLVSVQHISLEEYETQDGFIRQEYKALTIANNREDLTEEIMNKDIDNFRVVDKTDVYPVLIDITLPWEEGLVPDYHTINDFEKESEEDDEVA